MHGWTMTRRRKGYDDAAVLAELAAMPEEELTTLVKQVRQHMSKSDHIRHGHMTDPFKFKTLRRAIWQYTRPPKKHKYGVAPKEQRTYGNVLYDSKAERCRAEDLDLQIASGLIKCWDRQVRIQLGPDFHTVVDFAVENRDGRKHVEEVKGVETQRFKLVRRLWLKYGPCPMLILKRTNIRGTTYTWKHEWLRLSNR